MASIQRDIGTLTADQIQADPYKHYDFVSVDGGVDFGVVRYTNRERNWTGDLDGSSQTWTGGDNSGLQVERVSQSNTSILDVSSVSFLNVFDTDVAGHAVWGQREIQFGLKDREVVVYDAWWDPDDDTDAGFIDKFILFRGKIGATEHRLRSRLSLVPFRAPGNIPTGRMIQDKVCSFALARLYGNTGEAAMTCNVDPGNTNGTLATFPTCPGTPAACIERDNYARFGGFPRMLKPNTTINWGNVKVPL
ncbi:MAG TPA: hypothetical protein PLB01_00340 [Thermoanaerobaculia bacterium]|nr:hypothetical protein [Thermoanaerobaculia bacterium]